MVDYWIGVDGGGTGTRVVLGRAQGEVIGRGQAGPSALGQGVAQAWTHILQAVRQAFEVAGLPLAALGQCALGAGLSGVHNPVWRDAFVASNPGWGVLVLDSDATTMLLGAHAGQPGVMVAAGTGSVGAALLQDGTRKGVGGWGFPVGDEGSGAWMGLQAMRLALAALDGRTPACDLTRAVLQHCGSTRSVLQAWCAEAGQFGYASLAPLVFANRGQAPRAQVILDQACVELETMAYTLDVTRSLPVVFCGSIGEVLKAQVSAALRLRMVEPKFGAVEGALQLLKQHMEGEK